MGPAQRFDWIDRLGQILVPSAILMVFLTGFHSLTDPDIWFHLRAGKEIAAGHIPRVDTFSYPSAGRPYIDLHWLFQFVLYQIFRIGGEAALVWFACLVATATYWLIYRLARREAPAPLAAALVSLGIVLGSERLSPRPEILTFFFLALTRWLLRRHAEGSRRAWHLLPLVTLAWVNTEGLFVLGFGLMAARLLDRPRDRVLWRALALSLAASLINPYFVQGALHPLVLFTRINHSLPIYSATIGEFMSPFIDRALHPSVAVYPFYLGLLALGLLACGRWPRRSEILLLAVFVYLSLSARRNLALLPLIATPILARWLTRLDHHDSIHRRWGGLRPTLRRGLTAAALVAALLAMFNFDLALVTERIFQRAESCQTFGPAPTPVAFARGAARYLSENHVRGPIFSTFMAGSYFTWAYAAEPVFIDGRLEVHSAAHYERYLRIMQGGEDWTAAEREFGFNAVVIQQTGGQGQLLNRVLREGIWAPVHLDETAIVLLRRDPANDALIQRDLLNGNRLHQLFPSLSEAEVDAGLPLPTPTGVLSRFFLRERFPWSRVYLGQFFLSINRADLALAQFVGGVREAPGAATPRLLAAMTLNQMKRSEPALRMLEVLDRMPASARVRAQALTSRGDALVGLNRPAEAIAAYTAYLRRPYSAQQTPSVLANRALARVRSGDVAGAEADVRESLRRQSGDPLAYWVLGLVEEARGRPDAAKAAYLRFRQLGGRSPEVDAALARLGG
jgi:tetratricopeptide (TPR) repeat protein